MAIEYNIHFASLCARSLLKSHMCNGQTQSPIPAIPPPPIFRREVFFVLVSLQRAPIGLRSVSPYISLLCIDWHLARN